jgi:hypothetical protein
MATRHDESQARQRKPERAPMAAAAKSSGAEFDAGIQKKN